MRHYSKVLVELPDSPNDPPYAVVHIDCDVCGEEEVRIHMQHLGTVLRTLDMTLKALDDDGTTDAMTMPGTVEGWVPSTDANKAKLKRFMDDAFPDWKTARLRHRHGG